MGRPRLVNKHRKSLPADLRPFDATPIHTTDLPDTPIRDRNIPAEAWLEAPEALLRSAEGLGEVRIAFKRRLGRWLLWRAGPARGADARYIAVDSTNFERIQTFRLRADGSGSGIGPDGTRYDRFRGWKMALHQDQTPSGDE